MKSAKSLLVLYFLLSLFLGGCGQLGGLQGQAPIVNISDPAVYTSLHLHAAKKHLEQHIKGKNTNAYEPNDSFSVMDDMARYFRKTPTTYDKYHLRMDDMLDDSQRISDALHVYESMMRLALRYSPLGLQGTGEPLSTGLIPSSLFSGSKETQEKLRAAEKAQKVLKEKEADLKKAEAKLAKANESYAEASAFVKQLTDRYEEKKLQVVKVETKKNVASLSLEYLEGRLDGLKQELSDIVGEGDRANEDSEEVTDLENQIKEIKNDIHKKKTEILQIDKQLVKVKGEAKELEGQVEREKNEKKVTNAKSVVNKAVEDVNAVKIALSKAEKEVTEKQDTARLALAEEVEHPLAALRPKLVGLVSDSPFDRIDRARDFYTAYMLKILRSLGDSRVITPDLMVMEDYDLQARAHGVNVDSNSRLLLVAFQAHVEPGTRANYMVGLRLTVKGVRSGNTCSAKPEDVKIIQLHPTRAYDIENQLLLERINTAFGLSLSGSITGTEDEMKFLWEERKKSEARRNFLSRISKIASFADAGRNEFGWNFYPSNIMFERKGLVQSFSRWQKSGPSGDYVVNAYLEGGARDCCAYILVPNEVDEIDLGIEYVIKSVAHEELNLAERRYHIDDEGMRRRIKWLRKPSAIEEMGSFFDGIVTSPHDRHSIDPSCGGCSGYSCVTLRLPEWHKYEAAAAWPPLSTSLKQ